MTERITPQDFLAAADDWRCTSEGGLAFFRTRSFAESVRFIQALGELKLDPAPDLDVRHDGVTARLITYTDDYYGMSRNDVERAQGISAAARKLGLSADPSAIQSLLIIPGAPDIAKVMPFWRAVLGYEPRRDSPKEDLVHPGDRTAPFWFEGMKEPRGDGGGAIHVCVWLPYERAKERIEAALAAGGRMVRDEFAPSWWTLADAAGNEADIATIKGR